MHQTKYKQLCFKHLSIYKLDGTHYAITKQRGETNNYLTV